MHGGWLAAVLNLLRMTGPRVVVRPGPGLWSREPAQGLAVSDYLGEFKLARGGPAGERRRPYVKFGNRPEVLAGDALAGTPAAAVEGAGPPPTVSDVSYGSVAEAGVTIDHCLLFTVAVGTAPAGRYVVRLHAETAGGAIYEPWAYLKLEDSRP